jgi:asparagine synthase (glutamine-hydrolysing)
LLARDRLGIKPLFLARTSRALLFGSEIKSIQATPLVTGALDWQGLDEYLAYTNVPCPRTIYADIEQLPPGTSLTVGADGSSQVARYWTPPVSQPQELSEAEWVQRCENSLRSAVQSHLVSDVPVGAFLSGGVDSGLMVALMAQCMDRPVDTFTVGFRDAGSSFIDERQYARQLAARYKLNHRELDVTPNLEEIVADIVTAFDQPFADDSVVPSYYVSKMAASHVKVALTGLGGDELFAGYRRHLGLLYAEHYQRVPRFIRESLIQPALACVPESRNSSDWVDHLKRFARAEGASAAERYRDMMTTLPWAERRALYTPDVSRQIDATTTEQVISRPFSHGEEIAVLERALRTDLQTYLVDDILTLTDRLSMWHSLELRVPYLDRALVELAACIPAHLKIRGLTQKYLLKRVAERWLPREMIYHRKQGFEAPMGRWLRGPLLPFFDSVVNRKAVERAGVFRFAAIERLRNEHVSGRCKHSKVLFSLLMWHLWERRAPASAAI